MDIDGLELLPERECRQLVASEGIGRVAVVVGGVAAVFPVNYITAGDDVLFWSGEGTKLSAAVSNATVTFQVDHVDPLTETGWSVLAVGPARERTEPSVLAGAKAAGLRSWAAGDRGHLIALQLETLTGRRLATSLDLTDRSAMIIGPRSPISVLAQRPLRVSPEMSVRALAELMESSGASCVLVGDSATVVSRADVVGSLRTGLDSQAPVVSLHRVAGSTVQEDVSVVEAAARMLRGEVRHLLVCDMYGEVTGVVGIHDLLRILLDAMDPAVWVMLRETILNA